MINNSSLMGEFLFTNSKLANMSQEEREMLAVTVDLFEDKFKPELLEIETDLRQINILSDQLDITEKIVNEYQNRDIRTLREFQELMLRMEVPGGEKPEDDQQGTRKERVVKSAKRLGSSIRKIIDELIAKAVKFLRKLFDINNKRIAAAEKIKDAISKSKLNTQTTIRFKGPAVYFVNTSGSPSVMNVSEIVDALRDADIDIDRLTDELYALTESENPDQVIVDVKRIVKSYFKQTSDVKDSFAVLRPTTRGSAPLRMLFKESGGKIEIYTESDQNVMSRLKQNDGFWSMHGITKEQAIELCDGALECYNLIKLSEKGIPTPSEKNEMISNGKNIKAATIAVTAAVRTTVAYSRYLGYLANGAVWIAKSYYDNRKNRTEQPV